ncbi:pleiotropic regulatory protein RsmS [Photobacterium sp. ZSDE20]|uniref:Pleiotropic regulatory protein RsmS n=2 Tax=Photobacterium pectinilyticum TaxID=2906793 RepID=A0ABT1MWD7_9GAMM|nr:pleiotropic regulatory protein RsmS [Photobacterium sp. ZSDE20]MCQ1056612.1 pleiotropic regulatory protein RsmS [Photobacterium sp. ZSDE20]MDD1820747.1 pleiotropic regulatory protein RsmS [Photobacterium sp. ZSDE20]
MMTESTSSPLDNAPDDIKLAVDLIYLLESNEVDLETGLSAINIVKGDLEAKLKAQKVSKAQ